MSRASRVEYCMAIVVAGSSLMIEACLSVKASLGSTIDRPK